MKQLNEDYRIQNKVEVENLIRKFLGQMFGNGKRLLTVTGLMKEELKLSSPAIVGVKGILSVVGAIKKGWMYE